MGFLESLVAGIESLGEEQKTEEDAAFRKVAERLAEKEQGWVKEQITSILLEAAELSLSPSTSVSDIQVAHKKMTLRLTKFAEEAFQRGVKAASRMNVISQP